MDETHLLLLFLIICWTLNPFLKKKASTKLTSSEFMLYNHSLCTILILIYGFFLLYHGNCDVNCLKKLSKDDIFYSIIAALITVLSSLTLIKLLKENQATDIIPYIQPLVILFTILFGYFIFNETMTKNKVLGISFIIIGLIIINNK